MGEINVAYLKSGMVLASDVRDTNGRFLVGSGSVIQDKHIRILKMWGVTAVNVQGVNWDTQAKEEIDKIEPTLLAGINEYLDFVFAEAGDSIHHEFVRELRHLCVLRLANQVTDKKLNLNTLQHHLTPEMEQALESPPPRMKHMTAEKLVAKSVKLASFPDIYHQIVDLLNDTKSSASHLAQVVSSDPGLSATLLKLVNSVFYGLPTKVNTITRAIALIGGKELSTLALGISVIRQFKDVHPQIIDMKKFWIHCIATGVFSRILAFRKVGLSEEELFIGGLLHDIGRLVLLDAFPKTEAFLISLSRKDRIQLYHLEQEYYGFDHTTVAGLLMAQWNFPEQLEQMIRFHHSPLQSAIPLQTSIIYLANAMATALQFGFCGNSFVPQIDPDIWGTIDLSPSILSPSLKQADRQVDEILNTFFMNR